MPIATAPSAAAMQQLVTRINAGSPAEYTLPSAAVYAYQITEDLKGTATTEVTVTPNPDGDGELEPSLDYDNYSGHVFRVWVRKKVADTANATINALNLLVAQIADFIDRAASDTSTIKVMEVGVDWENTPDKDQLSEKRLYSAAIDVRVEVES